MASYLRLYANEMLIHSCHRRRWMRIRTCLYFYYSSLLSFVSFPPSGCHKKQISMINYISHCAPVENELVALYRWSMRGGECRQRALALALFLGAAHGPDPLSEETESAGGVKLGWISGLFIDRCVSNSTSSNLKRRKLGLSEQHLKPKKGWFQNVKEGFICHVWEAAASETFTVILWQTGDLCRLHPASPYDSWERLTPTSLHMILLHRQLYL